MYDRLIRFIRNIYNTDEFIPLHEPRFIGNEKKYLEDCIDSTFVSSVGKYVDLFEETVASYCGAGYAVSCVNGTEALHLALRLCGVKDGDEVISQPLTFIATINAITYAGAKPVFLDVDNETLGLSPQSLKDFLGEFGRMGDDGFCYNRKSGNRISACVPMHTFGHPVRLDELNRVCREHNITIVEDAAESLGSRYKGRHTGSFGKTGILSFNGNKTITTGGGGMILSSDEELVAEARHLTTQAKISHPWEYEHDRIGYNFRMPNINAALGCSQMENLDLFIQKKRILAGEYLEFFKTEDISFFTEPQGCASNYWLNTVLLENKLERDRLLSYLNKNNIMTRPAWQLINTLDMYKQCQAYGLKNAESLSQRIVNLPSSVPEEWIRS